MREIKSNSIGLTGYSWWDDWSYKPLPSGKDGTLENQLTDAGVSFERIDIKHLVGMGGCAYLIFYTSPNTGKPVTTLCVPHHEIIDSWGMEYFIFAGMPKEQALKDEGWWLIAYDAAKELIK
ncbi:MAG: hypothetical protein M0R49_13890 [Limnochordia bacterium]|jgi:hypothetical protein|nr:hypothetical protein [Limnochordia bacterium]